MTSSSDHTLLFGIIALQMDFVRRDQLVAATSTWLADKTRTIEEILVEQGALSEADRHLLAPLVTRHLENHDGDPQQSLAALSTMGSVADELRSLGDANVEATLSIVATDQTNGRYDDTVIQESKTSKVAANCDTADSRFRILRSHAKGGLGEVYVAQDSELNREVALKEIQSKYAGDENSRLRFLTEAEVTGGLEHPGIVPVYGLGRYDDGRPFYAMRFIKGDSLQEAADRFHGRIKSDAEHGTNRPDFNGLEFRKLLGRFIDVCQAIEYAHSRGVLHRDLKPGNIMLGKYGETLVVDWGLAKAKGRDEGDKVEGETMLRPASAADSAPTMMGSAIGTPGFMPPEQAAGDLDRLGPGSDVYSLGATLYYLLTGQPPITGQNLGQLLERVKSGEFLAPEAVQPLAPKAVAAICLKAMSLHEEDRYASPQQLADDIERFLADERVVAFREPLSWRVRRWARKHQTFTVATAAVVLVSAIGLAAFSSIVSGKNAQLTNLNSALQTRNHELDAAKSLAESNELSARQQSQLALATLTVVIQDIQDGLKEVSGGGVIRRRLLSTSLAKLNSIADQYVDRVKVDRQTVSALLEMGKVVLEFGPSESVRGGSVSQKTQSGEAATSPTHLAEKFFQRAKELSIALTKDEPENSLARSLLSVAYSCLGNVRLMTGKTSEALDYYQKSHAIDLELASVDPTNAEIRRALSVSHEKLGDVQRRMGDFKAGESSYQEALRIRQDLVGDAPNDSEIERDLSVAHEKLGDIQSATGRDRDAVASFKAAVEIRAKLAADNEGNSETQFALAAALGKLAQKQDGLGDTLSSIESRQAAIRIQERLMEENPQAIRVRQQLAENYGLLGSLHRNSRRFEEALGFCRKSVSVIKELAKIDPDNEMTQTLLADAYERLGSVQMRTGKLSAAQDSHEQALQVYRRLSEASPKDVEKLARLAIAYDNFSRLQVKAGKPRAALASNKRAIEIFKLLNDRSPNAARQHHLAIGYSTAGNIEFQSENFHTAIAMYEKNVAMLEVLDKQHPGNGLLQFNLAIGHMKCARTYMQLGDYEKAIASHLKCLEINKRLASADPNNAEKQRAIFHNYYEIAETHETFEDWAAAATAYRQASKVLGKMIEEGHQVAFAKSTKPEIDGMASAAESATVALGTWDDLLAQPQEAIPALLRLRAVESVKRYRISMAAKAAMELSQLDNAKSEQLYDAACVLCRCAAATDAKKQKDPKAARRQLWIKQALASLKKAVELGWKDFDHMRQDKDLAIIRDRAEFKALFPMAD